MKWKAAVLMACSLAMTPAWADSRVDVVGRSCEAIAQEVVQAQQRADELHDARRERIGRNAVAAGAALIFWPALLAMRIDPSQEQAQQEAQARADQLLRDAEAQGCADVLQLPAAQQAALPIAVGDVLVYRERSASGAVRTLRLRVQRLERRRFLFELQSDAVSGAWVQDRAGNVLTAPAELASWRGLLQPALASGTRVSGELMNLHGATAQLKAQVVAEHAKTPFGSKFDPVVLDLQGDIEPGTPPARAQGVMVVDRLSGILLRLEVQASDPQFDLERQLVHIEAAPR
ncbi:hypothetical protein [Azohydromonas caseinilytica]|uniref:Uncharacterized protein n=1 Tax=Azohydromonas caseinilytica TaxID=2728836 RepID=A0A848FHR8_9BURK|nr:hypothetical protein [Azohydromonas caseinilytica]NML19028.1 hypothetical protein [Azohydromonas caseinilytica]